MLNPDIIDLMRPLAAQLTEKGVRLKVAEDSSLSYITTACGMGNMATADGEPITEETVSGILAVRAELDDHCAAMDAVAKRSIEAVRRLVGFSRRSVMPDVKDLYEKVKTQIDARLKSISEPYSIIPIFTPDILKDPRVADQVSKYAKATTENVPLLNLPRLSTQEILEKIATSDVEFNNKVIRDLKGDDGLNYAADVWAGAEPLGGHVGVAYALFLLANAMYENPPENTNISLIVYQTRLSLLIEQCALVVNTAIERSAREIRSNSLYSSSIDYRDHPANDGLCIYVNNDVYVELLKPENGLTPEALMGNEIAGRSHSIEALLDPDVRRRMENRYNENKELAHRQHQLNEVVMTRNAIGRVFAHEIATRQDIVVQPELLQTLLKDKVELLDEDDFKCLQATIRDLTCDVFYRHTDAKRYLRILDNVGEQKPDMDVRTAALVALMEYTCAWMCSAIIQLDD